MENKKSKKIIISVICAVVAVALIVAILAITGVFGKDPSEDPSNSTTENATESTTKAPRYDPLKYAVQGIDDEAYVVLLDEDGNAIINDKNQIVVVDRDDKGNIIKDEKGEPQTHLEQIDKIYITKDVVYSTDYTINVVEGWECSSGGFIVEDNFEGKCQMRCVSISGEEYDKMNLQEYLEQHNVKRIKQKESREKQGYQISYEEKEITITDKKIPAVYCIEKTINPKGNLGTYYEILYFELNGNKYRFQWLCTGDESYNANKDFDFIDYVNKNFIVK